MEEEEQKSLAPIGCVSYPWATFHGVHEFVILRNSLEKVSEREMMLCGQMLKPRGNNGRSGRQTEMVSEVADSDPGEAVLPSDVKKWQVALEARKSQRMRSS